MKTLIRKKVKKNDRFVQGYMCALATIVSGHGTSTPVEEAYGCCFHTEAELKKAGVYEGDIEKLMPLIKENERRRSSASGFDSMEEIIAFQG
jgi:hypothetical protein